MKKKIIHIILILFGALQGYSAIAQDYTRDMLKIREGYKNKYHSFRMNMVFYPYDSLAVATDSMRGYCKMEGASYYYDIRDGKSEYEYLRNGKYYLVVDHPNKVVALKADSKARAELWNLNKLDSLLNTKAVKISYKELNKTESEYDLAYSGRASWNRLKVKFNKVNYTMSSIYMYSEAKGKMLGQKYAKPRVGIYYSDYSEKAPENNTFSENKYFHSEGDKTVLAETYKGYKLLDYIHTKRQ